MELDPILLSRLQFAFVVSFHIIFPAFTIGLAAWLATIEGVHLAIGNPVYRRVFDFWLRIFALSFAMGVVSGIVMAFQFGTNWSVLSERTGPIQGPLLGYEGFTAFLLEATFFGVMLLGHDRVPRWFYFFSCCMVSLDRQRDRSRRVLAERSAACHHSVFRVSHHGRYGPDHGCDLLGRRRADVARTIGERALVPVGGVSLVISQLPGRPIAVALQGAKP
jgi:hypothetical protein